MIILTFRMNGSPAMSIICLDSDLILGSAIENPTSSCDVVKQHCDFSLQYSISSSGSTLNASFIN